MKSYIDRINEFWNWKLLNNLSSNGTTMYLAILHCGNRCGWKEEFNVPNSTLLSMTSLELRNLYKVRNTLIQKKLVSYKQGTHKSAGIYTLLDLSQNNMGTDLGTNTGTQMGTQTGTQMGNIPRVRQRHKDIEREGGGRFDEFWEVYPKKVGKAETLKSWNKINPDDALVNTIFLALGKWQKAEQWQRDEGRFIPYPATWLNQKRWEDEIVIEKPKRTQKDSWFDNLRQAQAEMEEVYDTK